MTESKDLAFWKPHWGLTTGIVILCAIIALVSYVALTLDHRFGDYGEQATFPEVKDWSSVRITLDRDFCGAICPAYAVQVAGDGTVTFKERNCVNHFNLPERISEASVKELVARFRAARFLSLKERYVRSNVFDVPTNTLSLRYDDVSKTVVDYAGLIDGMPLVVKDLQNAVDDAAQTARWSVGSGLPCLGLVKLG
jgi:hypothetical protein